MCPSPISPSRLSTRRARSVGRHAPRGLSSRALTSASVHARFGDLHWSVVLPTCSVQTAHPCAIHRSGGFLVSEVHGESLGRGPRLPSPGRSREQVGVPAGLGITGPHPVVEPLDARIGLDCMEFGADERLPGGRHRRSSSCCSRTRRERLEHRGEPTQSL